MSWITRLHSARLCSNQPFAVVFVADADRAETWPTFQSSSNFIEKEHFILRRLHMTKSVFA